MDGWTSPSGDSFLDLIVHYVSDVNKGSVMEILLDFIQYVQSCCPIPLHLRLMTPTTSSMDKTHTGSNLAEAIAKSFERFGISDKV